MKPNMGTLDRGLRFLAAVVLFILYYQGIVSGTVGLVLLTFAAIFVLTSFVSFCPLYAPFGFSTRKKDE